MSCKKKKIATRDSPRKSLVLPPFSSDSFCFHALLGIYLGEFRVDVWKQFSQLQDPSLLCLKPSLPDLVLNSEQFQREKSDQFRAGNTIHIARTGKSTCLVVITERLLEALPGDRNRCLPVVRRLKCV